MRSGLAFLHFTVSVIISLLTATLKLYKRCLVDKYCFPITYTVLLCVCVGGFVWTQTWTQCLVIRLLDSAHKKNCSSDFTIWLLFHIMSYSVCSTAPCMAETKALLTVHLLFSVFAASCVKCNLLRS